MIPAYIYSNALFGFKDIIRSNLKWAASSFMDLIQPIMYKLSFAIKGIGQLIITFYIDN